MVAKKQRRRNRIVCAATSRNHKKRLKVVHSSDGHCRLELDSHADGGVFGKHCRVINDTGIRVSVDGFDPVHMQVNGIPIVTVAVAYDCPTTGHTFILFFHQSLHVPTMTKHLVSPFQLRNYGIKINETALMHLPKDQRTSEMHSILVDDPLLHIPLTFEGSMMSGFTTRIPTDEELQDFDQTFTTHIVMTSPTEWKPHSDEWNRIESALRAQLTSDYDLRQAKDRESRQLAPIQLRGQDTTTPSKEDSKEFKSVLHWEAFAAEQRRQVSSIHMEEMSELATPLFGGEFGDVSALDFDLEQPHFKQENRVMQARLVSSSLHTVDELLTHRSVGAIEVDRFGEAWLEELGVSGDSGMEKLDEIGRQLASARVVKRKGFVDAAKLAKNWKIGHEVAKKTIDATTQLAVRDFTDSEGGKRIRQSSWVLNFKRINCDVYCDTYYGPCKSLRGNKFCQIFATPFHFVRAYPMKTRSDVHHALDEWLQQIGVPRVLIPDGAAEMTGPESNFVKKARKVQCPVHPVEPYSPNQSFAEDVIRELKRMLKRTMLATNCPPHVWDWCVEWCALVRSHTAWNMPSLGGQTPATKITGDTSDISFLAEFGFYDWVWFLPKTGQKKQLGRFLCPSINVGPAMCGVVLTEKATTQERTSIWPVTDEDLRKPGVKEAMENFTVELNKKLKMHDAGLKAEKPIAQLTEELENTPYSVKYEPYTMAELEDAFDPQPITLPPNDKMTEKEQVDLDQNRFISARVKVPVGGEEKFGKVLGRKRDADGELIGKASSDPLQDTAVYDVEFVDGTVGEFTANIIAESIYAKCNPDGSTTALLEEITDHKRDDTALTMASGFDPGPNGTRVPKKTTKGWHLLARFKNGAEEWISLKAFKEASPVEVAEYALRNQLIEEPAFKWWAPHVLKKRKRILSAMKRRYFRTHTKFGIELPKTVERAWRLTKRLGPPFGLMQLRKK